MDNLVRGPTTFEFCESIPKALTLAQRAAAGRDIVVAGGADIAQQCLALGVVDELRLHIVPVLLGCGAPLFSGTQSLTELKTTDVLVSPNALHITFAVERP
jgi:dihydrofolate reductase